MWPILFSLTTFLSLASSSIHVKQSVKSSSETKSSIHVESSAQNGESEVTIKITGVPSPQITVIESEGRSTVNVEAHQKANPTDDHFNVSVEDKIGEKAEAKTQRNSLGNIFSRIIFRIVEMIFTLFGIR